MKKIKSYFLFSTQQRKGIFLLLICIVAIQLGWFFYNTTSQSVEPQSEEEKQWLGLQSQIDSLKGVKLENKYEIRPFNPNFISDYRAYVLKLPSEAMDRLNRFREEGQWINSAEQFQNVTQISNELL